MLARWVPSPLPCFARSSEGAALSDHRAGAVRKSGNYMAALSSIKPGLSDAQKAKQVGLDGCSAQHGGHNTPSRTAVHSLA